MTCRRFASDVIDVSRGMQLDPARHEAVLAHVRECTSCAALAERQRVMSVVLRRMADEQPAPPLDDRRLQTLLAAFEARPARPRRMAIGVGLSLAASALIVAGLSVGWKRDVPPHSTSGVAAAPAPPTNAADFVVLPGAGALPHFEHGEVIRVEVPSAGGAIQVEVLVGQDGLARAARLVQ
jgi:pimeloyl-ACP methyl ester carboxylesterase